MANRFDELLPSLRVLYWLLRFELLEPTDINDSAVDCGLLEVWERGRALANVRRRAFSLTAVCLVELENLRLFLETISNGSGQKADGEFVATALRMDCVESSPRENCR